MPCVDHIARQDDDVTLLYLIMPLLVAAATAKNLMMIVGLPMLLIVGLPMFVCTVTHGVTMMTTGRRTPSHDLLRTAWPCESARGRGM